MIALTNKFLPIGNIFAVIFFRNYGVSEFREELKTIFKTCGGSESRKLAFLVTDSDLIMVS